MKLVKNTKEVGYKLIHHVEIGSYIYIDTLSNNKQIRLKKREYKKLCKMNKRTRKYVMVCWKRRDNEMRKANETNKSIK